MFKISNKKNLFFLFVLSIVLGFTSCKKEVKTIEMMSGVVTDIDGNPIENVIVSSNGHSVNSDNNGLFTIENIEQVNERYVINFSKEGYFDVVKSGDAGSVGLTQVVLLKKNIENVSQSSTFTATKGTTVSVGKMNVNIPENGVMYEDGTPYTGKVDVSVVYLDPTTPTFQASMPGGDLVAKRDNDEVVPLVSYGMVNVVMKDTKGKKLQIKDEKKSKVTFPIPDKMLPKAPNQMPLWHFNEGTGLWEESGMATKNGNVYEGEVEHFSWVNLDDPKQFVVLNGKVKDDKGNVLPGIRITVEQVTTYSDGKGAYSVRIPSETDVTISVKSRDYLNYEDEFSVVVAGQPGNTTYEQNITLPSFPMIKGKLENLCDKNLIFPVYCSYTKDDKSCTTPFTLSKKNGEFAIKIDAKATNVVLCIDIPGGENIRKEVDFKGNDMDLIGSISVCRKTLAEREKPVLTVNGKETILENKMENSHVNPKEGTAKVDNDNIFITILSYNEDSIYMDGNIEIKKQNFISNTARIEKRKENNCVKLKVTATGTVTDENNKTQDATLEGTFSVPYLYYGKCDDFSKLCWNKDWPTFRTPMNNAGQAYTWGMAIHMFDYDQPSIMDIKNIIKTTTKTDQIILYINYKKYDDNVFKEMCKALEEAGFEDDGKEDKEDYVAYDYTKDELFVRLDVAKEGKTTKAEGKMSISITTATGILTWIKTLFKKWLGIDW